MVVAVRWLIARLPATDLALTRSCQFRSELASRRVSPHGAPPLSRSVAGSDRRLESCGDLQIDHGAISRFYNELDTRRRGPDLDPT
jgi:hypothetical protein